MSKNDLTPELAYVYELRWPDTNEIYIGSTSRTPEERFKDHQQRPYDCYAHLGIENAQLGFCFDYKPAHNTDRSAEARWKRLSAAFGYKILDGGDTHSTPLRLSEASKKKRSEALKGAKNHKAAPFTVTFQDGTVLRFETTYEAIAHHRIQVSHMSVSRYLNGKSTPGGNKRTAHLKGCIFAYV